MTPTVSLEPEVRHYLNDRYAGNETRDRTQYSAWVKVQMPLYQGGGLTARRNAAGHAVESAQSTIQRTRLEVRQKLLEARSQVMSLMSTLQIQAVRKRSAPAPASCISSSISILDPARCSTCSTPSRRCIRRALPNSKPPDSCISFS